MDTLGARIRAVRRTRGLQQTAVADHLDVDQTTVSAWERDVGPGPRVAEMQRLAALLSVDFTWLATGEGDAPDGVEVAA